MGQGLGRAAAYPRASIHPYLGADYTPGKPRGRCVEVRGVDGGVWSGGARVTCLVMPAGQCYAWLWRAVSALCHCGCVGPSRVIPRLAPRWRYSGAMVVRCAPQPARHDATLRRHSRRGGNEATVSPSCPGPFRRLPPPLPHSAKLAKLATHCDSSPLYRAYFRPSAASGDSPLAKTPPRRTKPKSSLFGELRANFRKEKKRLITTYFFKTKLHCYVFNSESGISSSSDVTTTATRG